MAVPSSGELELRGDIALEVYGSATGNNISLGTMSNLAGFTDPDAMSEFYGYSSASAPSVTTNNISNVGETSVTLNGNVTSDGGATITERGFYFGTNSSSPANNTKYTVSGTTGFYSNNRTGLSASTTYYCWAFATNSAGTTYGSRVQAATIASFSPTFANASTSTQSTYFNVSAPTTQDYIFLYNMKFYRNPNTNAYVLYEDDSDGDFNTQSISRTLSWSTRPRICTNAVNLINANYTTYSGGINGQIRVRIDRAGSYVFSGTSLANYNFGAGATVNVFQNNSTGIDYQVYNDDTFSNAEIGVFFNYTL